ncbi:Predicted kinase, aminoglycoside phosphotransferase (APT) family [Amycolatopsis pretoriensis]|uniref:Predicted kinase, aminoglycoside phosphotransferase (APT) family n=1 Tax=Amycolatopsis pretoriensis TaxID=218821 RepID=A0A1H5RI86_9PSEU|nr:phosphotransferase family protein [Amycolatopsis pretoriensis]SEF37237.1 Predicted kinase, aminoglycoside phosphotransferase (APT) family [Amycolatopsis pretoriensis]
MTTVEVREEDAFDAAAVHAWLTTRVEGLGAEPPSVRQFPGGASNLTYLLTYPDRELILRRPPAGHKAASAHDMRREYRVQHALKPVFPYVPRMLAFGDDESVLGGDFYVMEKLNGLILRGDLPEGVTLTPEQARSLSGKVVDRLVDLHAVDVEAAGLADLGKGAGYVERQIRGWSDRYVAARTDNVGDFAEVRAWLAANQPAEVKICLIHNDYRLDNLVLDGPSTLNITGVLDWEMATLGDPLMELGSMLAYWVEAGDDDVMKASRRQPTHLPGMFTREEFVARYAEKTGLEVGDWRFYEVYGLFRLAAVLQQLYRRYHDGGTRNPAFKDFWQFVGYLDWRCREIIAKGSV